MRNRSKAVGVVDTITIKYGWPYFIKYKNDIHPPVPLSSEAISHLVYEPSKIKIKSTHLIEF